MDLNHYALEQMVAARLAEAREARRHSALVASLSGERGPRGNAAAESHGPRRFLRWLLGVPANTPAAALPSRPQPARTGAGRSP
jgi:hypothetical protein